MNITVYINKLATGYTMDVSGQSESHITEDEVELSFYRRHAFSTLDEVFTMLREQYFEPPEDDQKAAVHAVQREVSEEEMVQAARQVFGLSSSQESSAGEDTIFKTIPAFESNAKNFVYELDKYVIEFQLSPPGVRIYNTQYKINIYTTPHEIDRVLHMTPEQQKKLISAFGQVAYANKAIVLRKFLDLIHGGVGNIQDIVAERSKRMSSSQQ